MLRCIALALLVAALLPTAASAEDDPDDFARPTIHLALGGLYALEDFTDFGSMRDDAAGLTARAGARVSPHFGGEVLFDWARGFDVSPLGTRRNLDTYSVFANLKGFLLTGRIQPYASVGVGGATAVSEAFRDLTSASSSDVRAGFAARFGGGADVYVTRHWFLAVDAGYVIPTSGVSDLEAAIVSGAIGYRF